MSTVNIDTRARFAERLEFLCAQKGITYKDRKNLPRALAVAMVDSGIVSCVADRGYEIENTRQKIRGDLEKDSARTVDHLDLYCRYFGCSADFLMGYIDTPTHEEKALEELTALSGTSCRALLEKEKKIIRALDLLLPDLQKVDAYDPSTDIDNDYDVEFIKYCLFDDLSGYLTSRGIKYICGLMNDTVHTLQYEGEPIEFIDETGEDFLLSSRQPSALFMTKIQEGLQNIRMHYQNKNKAPA